LKADIFKLVNDWLREERNGKWLLVLDNADDARWLLETHTTIGTVPASGTHSKSARPLWEYLPQSQNGSVLVTTRSKSVALKLVEERDIVAVEPMDQAHAVALFERKLSTESDREDTVALVAALEFMPLAVVQAAAYINQRAPRCSVHEYIEKFQKTDRSKTSLLTHEAGHLRRDRDAKNSIIITWQISFDYIQQERPSAADLLSLMSFFDRQGIPEGLLRNRVETGNKYRDLEIQDGNNEGHEDEDEDNGSETSITDKFEDDILMLRNYSFIFVNIDETTFGMHRLVQLATRKWLEAHRQLERWKQQYIKSLCAEFPAGKYENWAKCRALFPHAQLALAQQPEGDYSLREWALLLYNAAWYAWLRGNSSDAEKMSIKSMEVRKQLGQDDSETISSQVMVALAYNLGERWKEAEELFVQVMETSLRVLGQEHPSTRTIMANLASTYKNQGRWKEAEELEVQVMETMKRVLGQEHPDTLTSIANLALTYRNQGRWKEAEELEAQVMETSLRVLDQEHPSTLTIMANLALTHQNQGRWKEAEELEVQVMETMKRVLGQEHPSTLTVMANLALTYKNQGRWKEAEELFVQVMETRKRVLGQEHPDTLTSMASLASTYQNQGRWKEAEELEVQMIETSLRVLDQEHPSTPTIMANLASTYQNQGRWKEAEELFVQVMETRKRVLGQEHPDTLTSMANLASTYWNQGRWKEAEELEVQVMETRKRVLGQEHPDTLTSMNNLALTWKRQNRDVEALELISLCLELSTRKLGANHPDTLTCTQTYNTWKITNVT
jgi:tetratricopeptide (TPR) repeat protein